MNTLVTQRDEHRSLYESYLEACNAHDFDRMQTFYTSTITVNDVPMDATAVTAQFVPIVSAFPDWHWTVRHLVIDVDAIALHFRVTGSHRGTFQGIEATGRQVTMSEFTLYLVEGGKFAKVWDFAYTDAILRQIGAETGAASSTFADQAQT